mmetsp:Transcript_24067/g.56777  ORF Transcript_24067/g.56777 Transcript_24067/m.56777 type:complete len:238 (-) Transcript_24067:80-793(-)
MVRYWESSAPKDDASSNPEASIFVDSLPSAAACDSTSSIDSFSMFMYEDPQAVVTWKTGCPMILSYGLPDSEFVGRVGLPRRPLRLMRRRIPVAILPGRSMRGGLLPPPVGAASTAMMIAGRSRQKKGIVPEARCFVMVEFGKDVGVCVCARIASFQGGFGFGAAAAASAAISSAGMNRFLVFDSIPACAKKDITRRVPLISINDRCLSRFSVQGDCYRLPFSSIGVVAVATNRVQH